MSGSVNKVILLGHLGAAPDVRFLASGQTVCEMRLATSETWVDKNEQKQERTEWHRIVVWGKTGENCGKYLDKGQQVYIEGRLQTRAWDDKDGVKRYTTEIVADKVVFLAKPKGRDQAESESEVQPAAKPATRTPAQAKAAPKAKPAAPAQAEAPAGDFGVPLDNADIPF